MKRAIISVSDKRLISQLSNFLLNDGFEIYSTSGTYKVIHDSAKLRDLSSNVKKIEDLTGFPEILNGRVKTLHPHIYAGLLADRSNDAHLNEMVKLGLETFDLVVCNLYPFMEKPSIETIDIGGVNLLRAASKNYKNVVVLSSPTQYEDFTVNYNSNIGTDYVLGTTECDRKGLAKAAFSFISNYDNEISKFMSKKSNMDLNKLGDFCLKYGMNPHQTASVSFEDPLNPPFELLNGTLGMINIFDIIHGWLTVKEVDSILDLPTAISMKHTSLAGLAVGNTITDTALNYYNVNSTDDPTGVAIAYMKSRMGDPLSSFGDFICISREVDVFTARLIKTEVTDGIAAPSFTPEALEILKTKKNGLFKIVKMSTDYYTNQIEKGWMEVKKIFGVTISQTNNDYVNQFEDIVDESTRIDYVLAHTALKYAQSNNISMAVDGQIIGMGCGQQNRVGCVKLAGDKAINWCHRQSDMARVHWDSYSRKGMKRQAKVNELYNEISKLEYNNLDSYPVTLASDGFFPFTDNIERAHKYGVKHIIHPGGSIRDDDIQDACDELGIKLVITGNRMFYH